MNQTWGCPPSYTTYWDAAATVIAVSSHRMRKGKPQEEIIYYLWSLRAIVKTRLRALRQCWSRENSLQ